MITIPQNINSKHKEIRMDTGFSSTRADYFFGRGDRIWTCDIQLPKLVSNSNFPRIHADFLDVLSLLCPLFQTKPLFLQLLLLLDCFELKPFIFLRASKSADCEMCVYSIVICGVECPIKYWALRTSTPQAIILVANVWRNWWLVKYISRYILWRLPFGSFADRKSVV